MFSKYGLPLVAVALLIFAVVHVSSAEKTPEKPHPSIQPPHSPYPYSVAGAGMVEPQTENISIGTPVPGVVMEVKCKVHENISVGDELFRLDDRQLQSELKWRQASLAASQANLTRLGNQPRPETLQMIEAQMNQMEANLADMRDQYQRTRELVSRKVASESELVTRLQAYRSAQAQYTRAQAEHSMTKGGAWVFDKAVAQAAVTQAEAQVEQVRTELERLVVRSRVEGEVLQVNVRPGEFVGAPPSQALIVVGNVKQLHVRVDIDEYDIPRFVSGAPARAMLKGQPKIQFPLKFERVEPYVIPKKSLTGDNTERVDTRVLQVIYSLTPGDRPLYVGQQLDVFIDAAKE